MADDEESRNLPELSRRTFIGAAAAAAGLVAIPLANSSVAFGAPAVPTTHTLTLRRREDLLRLSITLTGMIRRSVVLDGTSQKVFDPAPGMTPYLIVDLGPQVLGEQHFPDGKNLVMPVGARLSGTSRLAFKQLPRVVGTVPGMLLWAKGLASVEPAGSYLDGESINWAAATPRVPAANETLIEMPWWLVLSPHRESAWAHATGPVTRAGRTEAWHTRLATRQNARAVEDPDASAGLPPVTVRAVWLRDPDGATMIQRATGAPPTPPRVGLPFHLEPDPRDRADLVRLSTMTQANGRVVLGGAAKAIPATVALSPLGGHLRADGTWDSPLVSKVVGWQQRVWQGRVTFTRILRKGALFPWGFPAAFEQTVTRKFVVGPDGTTRPYLDGRNRVIVTAPDIDLAEAPFPDRGRQTPFTSITCRTRATPEVAPEPDGDLFVPEVLNGSGSPVMFDLVGTDWEGRTIPFQMPLMFAEFTEARQSDASDIITAYSALPDSRRTASVSGQEVAFASTTGEGGEGSTTFPAGAIIFRLFTHTGAPPSPGTWMRAYPRMHSAQIVAEPVSRISGTSSPLSVQFHKAYLAHAFGPANKLDTFLASVADAPVTMGAKSAGGMIIPDFTVGGFSRSIGPVLANAADLAKFDDTTVVDTNDLFNMFADIKLLGGIRLSDLLGTGFDLVGPEGLTLKTTVEDGVSTTVMRWTPNLAVLAGSPASLVVNLDDATLTITSTTTVSLSNGQSSNRTVGELTNLGLALAGGSRFISVDFERLAFTAQTGSSTDIDVNVGDVAFLGSLTFMETLAQYLPMRGNELAVDVDGTGISASLQVALPDVAVGAFTLTGIAVGVRLTIPFGSDPMRFRFNFSAPEDPFGCTVLGIGGAGSFVSSLGLDGAERIEVSAMLQGCVALDVGVATGTIRMAAGITFGLRLTNDDQSLELTAFVRVTGQVEVICIIEVSIELYLALTAVLPAPGERMTLTGEASVTVKVSVLCFSKSVEISVRKTIQGPVVPGAPPYLPGAAAALSATDAGEASDLPTPMFGDGMTQSDWTTWCEAFA